MRERILIIDDELSIAKALTIRLRVAEYEVRCAENGVSGLAAATEWRPHLIVLDIRMPGMDGFEVKRHLGADPELRVTPVIFLSANVQESARQEAMASGAHAYLTKPYEAKKLLTVISSALEPSAPSVAPNV